MINSAFSSFRFSASSLRFVASACLLICLQATTHAQDKLNYLHERWTAQDGLPVRGTTKLLQSRDGYLWLATYDGLVRFDGARFTVYNRSNSPGLPSNRITHLYEAEDDALWLRTEQDHIVRFRAGSFRAFAEDEGVPRDRIQSLRVDEAGQIWVCYRGGLSRFDGERFVPFHPEQIDGTVDSVVLASDGVIWVGSFGKGVYRVEGDRVEQFTSEDGLPGDSLNDIVDTGKGAVWVGSGHGVARIGPDGIEKIESKVGDLRVYAQELSYSRAHDELWISSPYGLLRLSDGELSQVGPDATVYSDNVWIDADGVVWAVVGSEIYRDGEFVASFAESAPQIESISTILVDAEGSIWLATMNDGLHRLKPALFTVYGADEGLSIDNVYPILEARDGDIWMGSWGAGIFRLSEGKFARKSVGAFISALCEDRSGRIWGGGVNVFGWIRPGGEWQSLARLLGAAQVLAIFEDRAGRLWVGSTKGLHTLRGDVLERVDHGISGDPGHVRVFCETERDGLWMGTKGAGIVRLRDGEFSRYTVADGLPSDLVRAVCQDEEGVLWIGTEGSGLCRMVLDADRVAQVTVYRRADGLFDETIHQILEDDHGRLWMSTNQGIFWVHRDELTAFAEGRISRIRSTSYAERDGMRSREANGGMQPAGMKASDGKLWFPTQAGAVVVDPDRIRRNEIVPPVVVELLRTERTSFLPATLERCDIQPGERNFEIEYTALSFLAPENVRFRYRLEGFDPQWIEAGRRRVAYYTNVPPGRYEFRVLASNNDGLWNEAGATLPIHVIPRFSETGSFRYMLAGMVGLIVLALYRLRLRSVRARERELRALVAERTRDLAQTVELVQVQARKLEELDAAKSHFFANISHEFRTPLTLTIGPLENLMNEQQEHLPNDAVEEIGLALRNSRRLLRLVNQILDVSKLEAGQMKLRARRGDLRQLLRDLAEAFSPLAERRGVKFRTELPDEEVELYFDTDLMEKVVSNLLSNAFKFTPEGGSVLLALETGDTVRFSIRDTGPGIPEDQVPHIFDRFYQVDEGAQLQAGTGIGLSLARELTELHGGTIEVETRSGFGCTFLVTLPKGSAHLLPEQILEEQSADRPPSYAELDSGLPDAPAADDDDIDQDVPTLLIVDDSSDIRGYVRRGLQPGFRVLEAENGQVALELARAEIPDLIVSDVMMPQLDGFQLCERIKTDPALSFVPVILLTAKATTDAKLQGLDTGADDYLTKPFEMRELRARVANLIASRRKLKESRPSAPTVHAEKVDVVSSDEQFIQRLTEIIEAEMPDEEFSVEALAQRAGLSRGHLHRRLKSALNETPRGLIRRLRLERAAQLLAGHAGSVSEIAYGVGFKSVSHFSRRFRAHFGVSASEFAKKPPTGPDR